MSSPADGERDDRVPITELLGRARDGDRAAIDALFAQVYQTLRGLARAQLTLRGRPGSTLDTTALVHEVYLKIASRESLAAEDRGHFFSLIARVMRHLVVDELRRRDAEKHGGQLHLVALDQVRLSTPWDPDLSADVLALEDALAELEQESPDLVRLVEMRFFAGLSLAEIAPILERSERTLKRDWRRARAFLLLRLAPEKSDSGETL